jgi:hypothetical protein
MSDLDNTLDLLLRQGEDPIEQELLAELRAVVEKAKAVKHTTLLPKLLGQIFIDESYNANDLSQNDINWSIDHYVAHKVGPMWDRLMALHQFLVSQTKGKNGKKFDFNHCDRFGMAFADEVLWKSMAFQTQSLTYIVVLEDSWAGSDKYQDGPIKNGKIHIRYCTTPGYDSHNYARTPFKELEFLADKASVAGKYVETNVDYFRYKDGRDRGYLCTVVADFMDPTQFSAENTIRSFSMLEGIIYDLASHIDCLPEKFQVPSLPSPLSEARRAAKKSSANE